ncbi:ArdC-like ssDNA-binding domain-containing protein [Vagococcus fluvialis]|uniref:ArdC-like ssDNA-binding domain-containing protein n=1 Tax=Vagococcus fluvialis TaxID=2738 RepID=UPI002033FB22|nr:ArdC-like ssDNA-binding domain-containing protein [Vagococcus fluvialis]MCM2139900.1 ImmA/IrrE family metallo-endopeptidase [Vagococcus fluvialis]
MVEKSKIKEKQPIDSSLSEIIKAKDYKKLSRHLEDGIEKYLHSDDYINYLKFISQFHKYSSKNVQLILEQNPDASRVAGFQTWKKMDRYVKKGSKALFIYAPYTVDKKDKDGTVIVDDNGTPLKSTRFMLKPVFDVSQTEGEKPLPKQVYNLTEGLDDPKKFVAYYNLLKDLSPVDISIEPIQSRANGYYNVTDKRIVVKEGLGEVMTLKVMIHEMAHAILHADSSAFFGDKTYRKQEFEAESVAYIVSDHLGFDTSDYSFGYLSSWTDRGNELSDLTDSLENITKEASKLIESIDKTLTQIYTLNAPENKFEERVAIARNLPVAIPREPKKEYKQAEPTPKKTIENSLNSRMSQ